jgi:hypothetical protein
VPAGPELVADANRLDRELQATHGRAVLEHRNVAAIGVDVQVLGIEVRNPERRHAARSQYGRAKPRSEMILWSSSIAV